MKLSKQERIAAIVVVILVILVAGVFLFIKPRIETIIETKATLAAKEQEYNDAVAKADTLDQLKTDIIAAYDKGKDTADMFFPELASYEADNELREFIDGCKGKANILVEDLEVTAPGIAGLSTSVFVPAEVEYALKDYATQGGSVDLSEENLEETLSDLEEALRVLNQAAIQVALGEAQTIGATTVTFTVKATTIDDLLKFADEVNNYKKTENGKTIRKSMELSGITFTDTLTTDSYMQQAELIRLEAEKAAAKVFKDKTGFTLSGYDDENDNGGTSVTPTPPAGNDDNNNNNNNNDDENKEGLLNHYYYEMPCTITFYSIERMKNPTTTLEAQDKLIAES